MRLVCWMAAGSALSAAIVIVATGGRASAEILLGMFGPLLETSGSWLVAEAVFKSRPQRLTAVMITGFAGKLVFFGAYVAFMLKALSLRPVPFVASFTMYFVVLHLTEALALRRLFEAGPRGSR
jgi:hypothetical protein